MEKKIIVKGMKCNHCKTAVENELKEIEGVQEIKIELETGEVIIKSEKEIPGEKIKNIIEELGYKVKM